MNATDPRTLPGVDSLPGLELRTVARGPGDTAIAVLHTEDRALRLAYARLFAAAPELLAALRLARREIAALTAAGGKGLLTDAILAAVDAAIANATKGTAA